MKNKQKFSFGVVSRYPETIDYGALVVGYPTLISYINLETHVTFLHTSLLHF